MKRIALFASLILLSLGLPAFAQHPRLESGPASLLSSDPSYTAAPGGQHIGTAVPTDAGWIAVWADDAYEISPPGRRLLATRLLPDGTVRDTLGTRLTPNVHYRDFTALPAPGGARIFWVASRDGEFVLLTATVSDEGDVSDTFEVGEYPSDAVNAFISAAAVGTRTALLSGRYVMILDGTRQLKTIDLGGYGQPSSIVAAGSHFVASWVAAGGILMRQTLDLDGNILGPPGGTGVASPALTHDVGTDGSKALFAWGDEASVRLGLFDPASGQFDEKGIVASQYPVWPRAVWLGSSYLVSWVNPYASALVGVRVSRDGEVLDAQPVTLFAGDPGYFVLVARGSQAMLLRETGECIKLSCETDVVATPLGGESPPEHLLSSAASVQLYPSVASDGRGFLALWHEGHRLFATETAERSRTPTAPIDFGEMPTVSGIVASDGSGYLAAWVGQQDGAYLVEGKVLVPAGDTFTLKPFSLQGHYFPSGVSAGAAPGTYLLTWGTGSGNEAMRVSAEGTVLDELPIALFDETNLPSPPSIAFDGGDFVVAWSSYDSSIGPTRRLKSLRIGADGAVRFDRVWLPSAAGDVHQQSLACADGTCLLAWNERTSDGMHPWRVAGQRFRKGGELVDPLPFAIDDDVVDRAQISPSVAWDGRRFVVTWRKFDPGTMIESVEVKLIPASGAVEPGPRDLAVARGSVAATPVTACNLEGRCVIVAPDFVDDSTLGRTTRLFKRFLGEARHHPVRR